ncbi:hypothetical protein FACS1894103_2860 [Campylobacterota bacterium]|nr:hypothetical protein FACS1894103_2860 [Campylobacterota bacterium]
MNYRSDNDILIITDILKQYVIDCEVWAFGSRYKGNNRKYSDIDLCIKGDGKLERRTIYKLADAFEESDLPYRVDIADYHSVSDKFRAVVESGHEVIYKP